MKKFIASFVLMAAIAGFTFSANAAENTTNRTAENNQTAVNPDNQDTEGWCYRCGKVWRWNGARWVVVGYVYCC